MNIMVNGQTESCAPNASVAQFLAERGHETNTVVVERNGHILAREAFAQTFLQQGDKLEIVHFVGGG